MRIRLRIHRAFHTAAVLGCLTILSAASHAGTTQCADVGEDFATASPSSQGFSAARLSSMLHTLDQARFDIRAVLVLRDCHVVLERYKAGIGRGYNHAMYSVTKSISSTLVGALLMQGKIRDMNAPIPQLIERPRGLSETEWKHLDQISLKNVMQMASGFDYQHNPATNPIYDTRQDRVRLVVNQRVAAPPGTRFNYSDADATLTGTVIAGAAGTSLLDFAEKTLFEPLKMRNVAWWFPDQGARVPGGWGLRLRPMDMLKLGQLYLQQGQWNGSAIFAPEYREMAWAPGVSERYGLHWWRGRVNGVQVFFANGYKGQRIYIFPALNTVVAIVSSVNGEEETAVTATITKAVVEAANKNGDAIADDGDADLLKEQAKGFDGETRIRQEMQDAPRRF